MTTPPTGHGPAAEPADENCSAALLELLGGRIDRLRAALHETASIRRILIAETAQRDLDPLTCTASFVDVSELT